jgi:hypothetical protein
VDVSGIYKVIYSATYSSPALGNVERAEVQTVNVRFPALAWNLIQTKTSGEGNKTLVATVTPAYKIGGKTRLVGPSFGNAFGVEGGNVKLSNVNDNCDGSYTMTLTGNLSDRIKLYLTDEPVYTGPANEIGETGSNDAVRGFGLSLHGGITAPLGDLDTMFNRGYYAEADLAYRFSQKISLEAVGGYYNFEKDYNITAGNLYLKGHFGSGGLTSFAGIGGGIYKPEDKDATWGLSARAGLGLIVGQKIYLGAEASYFNIPDHSISFGTLGLAVKFFF